MPPTAFLRFTKSSATGETRFLATGAKASTFTRPPGPYINLKKPYE